MLVTIFTLNLLALLSEKFVLKRAIFNTLYRVPEAQM
jgi:hypothetical protein